ncbi:TetR/AcrR family transcriptional regulator [Paracoccus aerodenitrificans]|uniref:TetR/AcrR family transcriptional regulator n=1 Tax=Paracoccus aerodenitrificans TaxID=3017781 RepID=UPI0022F127D2|nr:TetR/AcrR family transcriptional regulator [Paracoccus aerodenitrificans]WBU65148.1 TetR/AcrR family transcriptional regulator [Paracoccus aerodenitrificans]
MARTQGSRAEITGPLIRQAAQRLFARHGFAAVSMRQIAAEVGVQVGTLYSYTDDKQALLTDLLRAHMEALLAEWQDDASLDPTERLDLFVRFHIDTSLDHADGVFLSYMELRNLTAENHSEITLLRRRYEQALQDILDDGVAAGRMRVEDTRLATMALIAMLTGVTHWYRSGGRLDREALHRHYVALVRGAVGAGA